MVYGRYCIPSCQYLLLLLLLLLWVCEEEVDRSCGHGHWLQAGGLAPLYAVAVQPGSSCLPLPPLLHPQVVNAVFPAVTQLPFLQTRCCSISLYILHVCIHTHLHCVCDGLLSSLYGEFLASRPGYRLPLSLASKSLQTTADHPPNQLPGHKYPVCHNYC